MILSDYCLPLPSEQPAGGADPGDQGDLIILFSRIFGDVFSIIDEIVIELTWNADLVRIDAYSPKLFQ